MTKLHYNRTIYIVIMLCITTQNNLKAPEFFTEDLLLSFNKCSITNVFSCHMMIKPQMWYISPSSPTTPPGLNPFHQLWCYLHFYQQLSFECESFIRAYAYNFLILFHNYVYLYYLFYVVMVNFQKSAL